MYIQITSRCNMSCLHCCFSCGPKGSDMSLVNFRRACALCSERGEYLCIGGGEPTIHPKFWEMLGIALSYNIESIWLATNGSQKETTLALINLSYHPHFGVDLSLDDFHAPIDPFVVNMFKKLEEKRRSSYGNGKEPSASVRRVDSEHINANGRALKNFPREDLVEMCPCAELFITPSGKIYACGHKKISFGTLKSPEIWTIEQKEAYGWSDDDECPHSLKEKQS